MSDRPTPETDSVAEKNIYGVACKVDVDFSRKLERERDEARDALMKIEEIYIDSDNTYDDWKAMGDVARKAVERWM